MRLLETFLEKILEIVGQCGSEIMLFLQMGGISALPTFRMSQRSLTIRLSNLAVNQIVHDSVHNQSEDFDLPVTTWEHA